MKIKKEGEECSRNALAVFLYSYVHLLRFVFVLKKAKGDNQGQGGVFELRSHVSPHTHGQSIAHCFSPFKPLSVTHPPLAACKEDKIVR